jgi:hypothetical protein
VAALQALYACLAPVLSSALGRGVLGPHPEPIYRLYNCQRCEVQVRICLRCDHGQIYCAGECARIRRRECLRRAGARYQRTRRGALCHAARQRAWRQRQQEVTHRGYPSGALCLRVSAQPINPEQSTDAQPAESVTASRCTGDAHARCAFCGAVLPQWTRLRLWHWNR